MLPRRDVSDRDLHDEKTCLAIDGEVSRSRKKLVYESALTFEALTHIAGIHFYIQSRSSQAATRFVARIFVATERIGQYPHIGHPGAISGTYEWTVTNLPYVIVFELDMKKDQIAIIGVFHEARNRRR